MKQRIVQLESEVQLLKDDLKGLHSRIDAIYAMLIGIFVEVAICMM